MRACVGEQTTLLAQPPAQTVVRLAQCRKSVPAPGHPCGLWRNSAGVGKNVAGFCPDCARIAHNISRMAARPGRRARIQERRSRGLSSVKGTACSTRAKYSSSSFSACARVAIGAPQFTDAIASSTAMKARAIFCAARMLRSPFWTGATHIVQLRPIRIEQRGREPAPSPSRRAQDLPRSRAREQHSRDIRVCECTHLGSPWEAASIAVLPMSEMVVQSRRLLHSTQVGPPDVLVEPTHT